MLGKGGRTGGRFCAEVVVAARSSERMVGVCMVVVVVVVVPLLGRAAHSDLYMYFSV